MTVISAIYLAETVRWKTRAYGHADIRTCGHTGIRTCGHTDMRTYGHADMRTFEIF